MFTGMKDSTRHILKISLSGAWITSAAAGLGGVVVINVTHGTPFETPFYWWITLPGSFLFLAALGAAYGVIANRYRWEWFNAWFAAMGFAPFLFLHWWNAIATAPGRIPFSLLLTAVFLFYITRAGLCAAHAAKLRAMHKETEGGDRDDGVSDGGGDHQST